MAATLEGMHCCGISDDGVTKAPSVAAVLVPALVGETRPAGRSVAWATNDGRGAFHTRAVGPTSA